MALMRLVLLVTLAIAFQPRALDAQTPTLISELDTLAADGAAALDRLASSAFDLVLMDMQMPVVDGFEALRTLRAREEGSGRRTPVIAMNRAVDGRRPRPLPQGRRRRVPVEAVQPSRSAGRDRIRPDGISTLT